MSSDYVSVNEAAEIKGVTRQRILQYINDGRLPAQKFADVYMIRRQDLDTVELKSPGRPRKSQSEKVSGRVSKKASRK
ncbi:MAG TPA: helix-turn-helix domain-containing protein [Pyrinomonadaceae bacterium]|nr:helix-turn-helix domain-containing protein [Pyrinomonadaceae bacterium]